MAAQQKAYFRSGQMLRDRWLIGKLLGSGAFGQVFLAQDQRDHIEGAIKTEKLEVARRSLCMEVGVMRDMGDHPHVPFIVACGRTPEFRYLVMECLGESLGNIIKKNGGKLSLESTTQVTLQCMSAIRGVHEVGYIHRDVKPANFAFGKHPKVIFNLFVFDFGLSRIHLDHDQRPRKRRPQPGFKGTLRYASLAAHYNNDLGRVDDLIPIFYAVIEMNQGKLPWKGMADRNAIRDLKEDTPIEELCGTLPKEYVRMGEALHAANYKSQPRYDKLAGLCICVLSKLGVDPNKRIDIPGIGPTPAAPATNHHHTTTPNPHHHTSQHPHHHK